MLGLTLKMERKREYQGTRISVCTLVCVCMYMCCPCAVGERKVTRDEKAHMLVREGGVGLNSMQISFFF